MDVFDQHSNMGKHHHMAGYQHGDCIHQRNAPTYILGALCLCGWPSLVWVMFQSGGGHMDGMVLAGLILLVGAICGLLLIGIVEAIAHIVSRLRNGLTHSVAQSQWPSMYAELSDLDLSQSE